MRTLFENEGILLYFLTAQTVFAKLLLFCKWKSKCKIGQI